MVEIVSDVGGTNARFALVRDGAVEAESVRRLRNDDHASYLSALDTYRDAIGAAEVTAIAVAVAGPVKGGRARMTNRDWIIDVVDLRTVAGGPVVLINDLKALGYALGRLGPDALVPIIPGDGSTPDNSQSLVVGMGTGCNVSPVLDRAGRVDCLDAEYGHSSMPFSVMERLHDALGDGASAFPTVEHLFSGRGLANLHAALSGDPPRPGEAIVTAATSGVDAVAARSLELFAGALGALTRDLAIAFLPGNGIYFAGGVCRAVLESPFRPTFIAAVRAERPESIEIGTIPVQLIADDFAPLHGCAYAMQVARR